MSVSQKIKDNVLSIFDSNPKQSITKIAIQVGCSPQTANRYLFKVGRDVGCKRLRRDFVITDDGYIATYMPEHLGSRKSGYLREHTSKAIKVLGRALKVGEVVHHINGNKQDNRNCNLLICNKGYHSMIHWKMSELYAKEHFT